MKNKKMIEIFDDIPMQKTVSSYSTTLNKLFKRRSLNDFVDNIKNPPKLHTKTFIEKFNTKYPKRLPKFSERKFILSLKKTKVKEENSQMKHWKTIKSITMNNAKKMKEKNAYRETPDPFRYTPNYSSIYKKSPCAAIIGKATITIDCDNSSLPHINENDKQKDSNEELSMYSNINKRNHSLKFSDYSSRKGIIDHPKYLSEPNEYFESTTCSLKKKRIGKVPDFSKMLDRGEHSLIYKYSLNVPASVAYHPNHDFVRERAPEVKFNKDKPQQSKKYLMRKLWANYDVTGEYHLVNFN